MTFCSTITRRRIDALLKSYQLQPWQADLLRRMYDPQPLREVIVCPPRQHGSARGHTIDLLVLDEAARIDSQDGTKAHPSPDHQAG